MNFLKVALLVIAMQFVSTGTFTFLNEMQMGASFLLLILMLIAYFVMYCLFRNQAARKLNISNTRFSMHYISSWVLVAIANCFLLLFLLGIGVLHGFGGFLSGIEYLAVIVLYLQYAIALLALNFIIWGLRKITQKFKRQNETEDYN